MKRGAPGLLRLVLCLSIFVPSAYSKTVATLQNLNQVDGGTPVTLHEDRTNRTDLAIVKCVEEIPASDCTCNVLYTEPVSNFPFDVFRQPGQTFFRVYYLGANNGGSVLDYRVTKTYYITVQCVDVPNPNDAVTPGKVVLEVDILPNQAPVIIGYPKADPGPFDAQVGLAVAVGSMLYNTSVEDPERDAITYSMTQSPNSGYLTIGSSDGIIKTAVDLRTVTVDTVICTLSVADRKNTVNNFVVTVKFNNLNTRPVILNLPATINVTETQATGFTLMTLTFNDDTPQGVALEPQCSVDPPAESFKFTYETGTRRLQLNNVPTGQTLLDFETTNKYTISCVVFDGYLYSQGDVLTMFVTNVNEPPVFSQATYFCTMPESNAGISTCNMGIAVTDPELNTISKVELLTGNNSERFQYNRATDKLTFNVNYDVDDSAMPTQVILTIYAVDTNLATGTAKIVINIQDANDNACDFGGVIASQFNINQGTTTGTLGSFAASDADLTSPNNQVKFEVIQGLPTSSLNYLTVFGNGEIKYVGLIPESDHGKSYALTVRCKDGGSPPLSSTGTVQVSYLTTTTTSTTTSTTTTTTTATTTTTTQAPDTSIWKDSGFIAVFAILMAILGIALLAALYYFCFRNSGALQCNRPEYERQPPPRQVRSRPQGDNFFRGSSQQRVSPDYKDHAWRQGDHYEDGIGYNGRPATKSDIFLTDSSSRTRALPAPRDYQGYY